ncbi:MAG: prepilin peptidase [Sarcina sp.]
MVFLVFIFAVTIGSFLNVCIYRIPAEKSIVNPPSSCGACNHQLGWKDLFPIFSYLFLKGKCRYCDTKVSFRYPFVEFMTGVLISIVYLKFGLGYEFMKYSILVLFLIVIAMIDYDTTDVYSITTIPVIAIGTIFVFLESFNGIIGIGDFAKNFFVGILGAIICGAVIWAICYFTGGMGEGDIEIAVVGGIFLGWQLSIFMILFSFILGALIGGVLIILKKKKRTDYIPFGPSIAISIYLVLILGIEFINEFLYKF